MSTQSYALLDAAPASVKIDSFNVRRRTTNYQASVMSHQESRTASVGGGGDLEWSHLQVGRVCLVPYATFRRDHSSRSQSEYRLRKRWARAKVKGPQSGFGATVVPRVVACSQHAHDV
ncbi:hypothetical protein SISSUDRAFT_1047725 [Sistotremastrum suecicum HHB10207 ss-3]|uniref:Uncharacterized protein n=1 Tax=Sistotremastrum suecicum HHB10207 ss-3 TaxID=1314776 RepID=A0A166CZW2_9AGAM|nr:hypothetical protein SISSUDRAFT_1047725 [Sistotremastrum suecicum HHB10207 ss-3]